MRYVCCDERRLRAVEEAGVLNGIEYLEVSRLGGAVRRLRQRTLFVRLLQPPAGLGEGQRRRSTGGERIARSASSGRRRRPPPPAGEVAGSSSPGSRTRPPCCSSAPTPAATSRATRCGSSPAPGATSPPAGFDPLLAAVEFSFKVECPSDFDCAPVCECPPELARRAGDRLPREGLSSRSAR